MRELVFYEEDGKVYRRITEGGDIVYRRVDAVPAIATKRHYTKRSLHFDRWTEDMWGELYTRVMSRESPTAIARAMKRHNSAVYTAISKLRKKHPELPYYSPEAAERLNKIRPKR